MSRFDWPKVAVWAVAIVFAVAVYVAVYAAVVWLVTR